MTRSAIVDTGPLVAYLDRGERHHTWAVDQVRNLETPLLVCEPVLAEAMFLLAQLPAAQDALLGLQENGALQIAFHLSDHFQAVRRLCKKHRDTPMSLADACVVRMAELIERHYVCTLDSDFTVYRKHGREPLALSMPSQD